MGAIVTFDPMTTLGREVTLCQGMSGVAGLTQQGWDLVSVVATDAGDQWFVLSRIRRTSEQERKDLRLIVAKAFAAGATAREAWAKEHGKEPFDRVAHGETYARRAEKEE